MTDDADDKLLCYCRNVRYGAVRRAIAEGQLKSPEQVTAICDAGSGCRSCRPEIEELLAEYRNERPSGFMARIRRLLGRSRSST